MTLREREKVMTSVSACMERINAARAEIALDNPEQAQQELAACSQLLLDLETLAGCYTPASLFGD